MQLKGYIIIGVFLRTKQEHYTNYGILLIQNSDYLSLFNQSLYLKIYDSSNSLQKQ